MRKYIVDGKADIRFKAQVLAKDQAEAETLALNDIKAGQAFKFRIDNPVVERVVDFEATEDGE